MQTRPYDSKDARRVWLSRTEQHQLLEVVEDAPRRQIAFQLGLHGLRSDEIVAVEPGHFRALADVDGAGHVLVIPDGKTGKRETPVSPDLRERVKFLKSAARLRADEPVIDVGTRQVRNWIEAARDELARQADNSTWRELRMHDLRRTFATDSFYSLALHGNPIAEQLVMAWGGWKQTQKGRETFRENYLGPVPDHVTAQARENLSLV